MNTKQPSPFAQKIYHLLKQVPKGKVTTYRELAHASNTKAYQAIGQVMRTNPYAPEVPCHRVVSSDGSLGGFRGDRTGKNITDKIRLLSLEGVKTHNDKVVDFSKKLHKFSQINS